MSSNKNAVQTEKVNSDEKFTDKHQTLWQFIKFLVFSQLAGLVELVSFAILSNILPAKLPSDFDVFVFHYTNDKGLCLGAFVQFMVRRN